MASVVETETFNHEPLPDASTCIRLLEVVSVDETREVKVHCRLTTWTKKAAPRYTAISYTWGDKNLVTFILVNSKRLQVRRNCEDVLRQPCWNEGGYFWIDAICINQVDNDEKSFQVASMGKVFQDARQTFACVGRHENDSEFLFKQMCRYRYVWQLHHAGARYDYNVLGCLFSKMWGQSKIARLLEAFAAFSERPYFHRAWVYQELFFGQDIQLCCEDERVQLSLLWSLYSATWNWLLRFSKVPQPREQFGEPGARGNFFLGTSQKNRPQVPLRAAIEAVLELGLLCEDPRDRVFGVLATIDWEDGKPIQPDYSKDRSDLGVEILQSINRRGRGQFFEHGSSLGMVENLLELRYKGSIGVPLYPSAAIFMTTANRVP